MIAPAILYLIDNQNMEATTLTPIETKENNHGIAQKYLSDNKNCPQNYISDNKN